MKRRMKGLGIAITILIVAVIVILVITSLTTFFFGETGGQFSKLEAERILTQCCQCSATPRGNWDQAVDFHLGKDEFYTNCMSACRVLHPTFKYAWQCVQSCGCELGTKEQVEGYLEEDINDILTITSSSV